MYTTIHYSTHLKETAKGKDTKLRSQVSFPAIFYATLKDFNY